MVDSHPMAEVSPEFKRSKHGVLLSSDAYGFRGNKGIVFSFSEPLELYADLCRRPEGLADAIGMLRALAEQKTRTSGFEKAVYVIAVKDSPITKIGISADPMKRLRDLQGSHYRELLLHGVIFCPGRNSMTIEQAVLEEANCDGTRLMGEWVAKAPEDVLMSALRIARDRRVDVCDGHTWFNNMVRRTKQLYAKAKAVDNAVRKSRLRRFQLDAA